ncbi:MAG: hypothetical protein JWR07_3394 [Nevskia sp.]|nr:hypothetical protein [Nevskia sp.]
MTRTLAFARSLGCALLIGLAGCGSSSPPSLTVTDAADVPLLIPTPGTASIAGTIDQAGDQRTYIGIVPKAPVAGAPLLVMLHPLTTTNVDMANLTRAGRLVVSDGAVVVLPQGENETWHDDPSTTGPDDVAFISAVIDRISQQYQTDPSRVYVMGFSQGGFMAERLVCDISGRLTAVAAVSSLVRDTVAAACNPSRQIPLAFINGTLDPVNSFAGQPNIGTESAPASAAFWAQKDGCSTTAPTLTTLPVTALDGTVITLTDYKPCPSGIAVDFYTVIGGGHTWPGSPFPSNFGVTTQNMDATLQLWKFFQQPS